jgi:cytochrome c553
MKNRDTNNHSIRSRVARRLLPAAGVLVLGIASHAQNAPVPVNQPGIPAWAYPISPPAAPLKDDGTVFHVPNSTVGMTITQARNNADVPDWHPDEHPPMPDVVKHGRMSAGVRACGYCHYPNGLGRPENASIAGLPVNYFIQQVNDFKTGLRKSSEPNMRPPQLMVDTAKAASDAEVRTAAEYFAQLKLKPWVKVVESKTAPRTEVLGGMLVPLEDKSTEPLGDRIIEVPVDAHLTELLRDSQSPFVAYVPEGSLAEGEALATTGGATVVAGKIAPGKTVACGTCHGPDLTGLGDVPPIAGRSPSYMVRQMLDMQRGTRNGQGAKLMKPVVMKLEMHDIIAISAYVSSLPPTPATAAAR